MNISKINTLSFKRSNRSDISSKNNTNVIKEKINGKALLYGSLSILAASGVAIALHARLNPKVLTLDKFKKLGYRFENGIPLKKNGKYYNGKIIHKNKNGATTIRDYADLNSDIPSYDVKRLREKEILSDRKYLCCDKQNPIPDIDNRKNGLLVHNNINNKTVYFKFIDKDNESLIRSGDKLIKINSSKKTISVYHNEHGKFYYNNGSKYVLDYESMPDNIEIYYHSDGKTKKFLYDRDNKQFSILDKSGNITKQINSNSSNYNEQTEFIKYQSAMINRSEKYIKH